MKLKLREIIVVEGKDDTIAIKRAVDADTIETNGSAINEETIEKIRLAVETRGAIVFTDPDFPGKKIRNTILMNVQGCKNAFLPKHLAIAKNGKGVGVEHASVEDIRDALKEAHTMKEKPSERISMNELLQNGFISGVGSKEKREKLGLKLRIGYSNGKQLYNRLRMFGITQEQFRKAVQEMEEEVN